MKSFISSVVLVLLAGSLQSQDAGKIDSIGLFKNGLAVVRIIDEIPSSGTLAIETVPEPVHGTFWITSDKDVSAHSSSKRVEAPLGTASLSELLRHLVGEKVQLHLSKDTIRGEILGETWEQRKEWERDYAGVDGSRPWAYWPASQNRREQSAPPQMIFVRTEDGVVSVPTSQILRVDFKEVPEITRDQPVLRLQSDGGARVTVEFLSKGMAWAPSYRIDLTNPRTLTIKQQSVIRNELAGLRDVELNLISGFPSVHFASVDSPLSARQTWANFFQQLETLGSGRGSAGLLGNQISSQSVSFNSPGGSTAPTLGPTDEGEGVDLHYQPIGRHSLAPGESLSLDVAEAEAPYERVVEWKIPDTRAPNGRYLQEHERQRDPARFDETPWDAIIFENPFPFPMTTAPAMLVHDGEFQGQQTSTWTNPGAETSLRITKALSIGTRSVEHEIPDTRENLRIAGNDHYEVQVQAELTVKNHRGRPAIVVIERQFSGDLIEADADPAQELLEIGIDSINKRNQLVWRVELDSGEERQIRYRYEVLVDN